MPKKVCIDDVQCVATKNQLVDNFTKPLIEERFNHLRTIFEMTFLDE